MSFLDERLAPDAAAIMARVRSAHDVPRHLAGVEEARARVRKAPVGPRSDASVVVVDLDVPCVDGPRPARLYRPCGVERATVLYFHGGGWALGDLEINDNVCRRIAAECGVALVSLDYRLAPEHPFPAALDDAQSALALLASAASIRLRDGSEVAPLPQAVAVAGLSAGGSLAAALARRARDGVAPSVIGHLLICPVLDHDFERDSYDRFGDGLNLTTADMEWFWDLYLPDRTARAHPDASPLRAASFEGIAPAVVVLSGADVLFDEGAEYCDKLRDGGSEVAMIVAEGLPHGMVGNEEIESARRALAELVGAFNDLLDSVLR